MCPRVSYKKKNMKICLASLKSSKKGVGSGVGSGAGSISQMCRSWSAPKCHGSLTLHRKVHGNPNLNFSLCLMIEASGSISLTNGSGCGSGRPKSTWILRIRIRNTVHNYYVNRNMAAKSTELKIETCLLCGAGRVHAQHGDGPDLCAGGVRERGLLHHCLRRVLLHLHQRRQCQPTFSPVNSPREVESNFHRQQSLLRFRDQVLFWPWIWDPE